jgi:hypothetical protein
VQFAHTKRKGLNGKMILLRRGGSKRVTMKVGIICQEYRETFNTLNLQKSTFFWCGEHHKTRPMAIAKARVFVSQQVDCCRLFDTRLLQTSSSSCGQENILVEVMLLCLTSLRPYDANGCTLVNCQLSACTALIY